MADKVTENTMQDNNNNNSKRNTDSIQMQKVSLRIALSYFVAVLYRVARPGFVQMFLNELMFTGFTPTFGKLFHIYVVHQSIPVGGWKESDKVVLWYA